MPSTQSLRVLVVDDDRSVADSIALIVEACGHAAHIAYDGEHALALADEINPDAAISDVMMPGIDGFEVAAWLERHHPKCHVLLISGQTNYMDPREPEAQRARAHVVLSKPVHPRQYISFLAGCAEDQPND